MTYTITQNLTNLTSGNIALTITPSEGYALPEQSDIIVTGGSIVSYDDETGVLVVTAGTTAVEVECEALGQTVTVIHSMSGNGVDVILNGVHVGFVNVSSPTLTIQVHSTNDNIKFLATDWDGVPFIDSSNNVTWVEGPDPYALNICHITSMSEAASITVHCELNGTTKK